MKYCATCQSAYPQDFQVCPRDNSPLRSASEIFEGLVIAKKYSVMEKIGSGGMATVYRAKHLAFNEVRAIKVVNSRLADEGFIKRFRTEAVIARRLQHPHAVRVDDLDMTEDGRPFIVMEFVQGTSLRRVIKTQAPLPVSRALNIAAQVAEALVAAHQLGIVHRDIKPDNVLLTRDGEKDDYVKVLDFGIAKVREGTMDVGADYTPTQTGMVVGTPAYISPEQARGRMGVELDGRADLYSLGVVAYEMVTGELPFHADTSMDMILHHLHTPPTPPHKMRPDLQIPLVVSLVLMKALEKDRESRFQSAEEMLAALRDPAKWVGAGRMSASAAKMYSVAAAGAESDAAPDTGIFGSENYDASSRRVEALDLKGETVFVPLRTQRNAESTQPIPLAPGTAKVARVRKPSVRLVIETAILALLLAQSAYLNQRTHFVTIIAEKTRAATTEIRQKYAGYRRPMGTPAQTAAVPPAPAPAASQSSLANSLATGSVESGSGSPASIANPSPAPQLVAAKASAVPVVASAPEVAAQNQAQVPVQKRIETAEVKPVALPANQSPLSAAAKSGEVHGIVRQENGKPAADITVELENTGVGFDQSEVTGSDGRYEFKNVPAGRDYTLTAIKDGETEDSRQEILVRAGVRFSAATLHVQAQEEPDINVRVYGRVFDAGGAPMAGALIKLENSKLAVERGAVTEAGGNYSFTEVPPGNDYKISVIKENRVLEVRAGVTVAPANVNPEQVILLYISNAR